MTTWAVVLSLLGGALELAGIALVVIGIRDDPDLAERYLERIETAPPASSRGPMTPEIRMLQEHEMRHGPGGRRLELTQERYNQDIRRIGEAASRATYEERARFQAFMRTYSKGGLGQRKVGVAPVGLGIVVSVAANVVSAS